MKIIKRLYIGFLTILYIVAAILIWTWWFIPSLFFGISHDDCLDAWFEYIEDYKYDNKLYERRK